MTNFVFWVWVLTVSGVKPPYYVPTFGPYYDPVACSNTLAQYLAHNPSGAGATGPAAKCLISQPSGDSD